MQIVFSELICALVIFDLYRCSRQEALKDKIGIKREKMYI